MPYLFTEFLDLMAAAPELPIADDFHETIRALIDMPALDPSVVGVVAELRRVFVLAGGFPELLLRIPKNDEASLILESQRILRSDAVERAIYKDIPQAFSVDDPMMLERLLYVLAGQNTGLLSPTNICKEMNQMSQPTFDRYLSYLERAFLVFTLPNYSGREPTIQKRGRRLYFVDPAIRNAALQRGLAPLSNPTEMGILLENMAASQLHALAIQSQVRLFHWRSGNDEVDLVYSHPEHPLAFEIASSASHSRRGLVRFCEKHPRFRGRCYVVAPDAQALKPEDADAGVGTLPLDLFLLATGRQAEAALRARLAC
jgi:predicted AAA+ superfamily ATPase